MLQKLKNENIVKMYSAFQDKKKLYFVLDYALNGDFETFLNRQQRLDFRTGQHFIAQIVNILHFLQTKKVVHRDLKPANLLLNESFDLILTDFGTAKHVISGNPMLKKQQSQSIGGLSPIQQTSPTKSDAGLPEIDEEAMQDNEERELVGTELYLAPEVLNFGCPGSFASDLWALGVIIY